MASVTGTPKGMHRDDSPAIDRPGGPAPSDQMKLSIPALSRLPVRLLAFNILLVFLPAGGMLFLGTYESHLLEAQERTMAQEGRLLAAALEASGDLEAGRAEKILIQLGQRHLARLRVVDEAGAVLADSASLGPRREGDRPPTSEQVRTRPQESLLYRFASLPVRFFRSILSGPTAAEPRGDVSRGALRGPEVRAALDGKYGAATRIMSDDSRSVMLDIAIPVRIDGEVAGAVVVSQSTNRIMSALYAVRLDVFKVFLASLVVAVVLTLLVAMTIARPLARLRQRAGEILDRRGRLTGGFEPSSRSDEIGDLERALAQLTGRLEEHLRQTESFAADVSHEFKNPLAAIRTATDMALEVAEEPQRRRFLEMIQRDVARMGRLLTEAREITAIDAHLDEEERQTVDLNVMLGELVESFRFRSAPDGPKFTLGLEESDSRVDGSPDRLIQVFENLLANAESFSPPNGAISLAVCSAGNQVEVRVADQGPGVPTEHFDRIFARFFSYRPGGGDDGHTGLGLSIVRAIVEGHGGQIAYRPAAGGGAEFVVRLPKAEGRGQ